MQLSRFVRVRPNDRQSRGRRKWSWRALLALSLAIPGAVVAVLQILGRNVALLNGWEPWILFTFFVLAVMATMCFLVAAVLRDVSLHQRRDSRLNELGRFVPAEWARHHSLLIRLHVPLLRMTSAELAGRAGLSRLDAVFLIDNPDFVPGLEIERAVRRALMVPDHWPAGDYGEEFTKERLIWFSSRNELACTAVEVEKSDPAIRAAALASLEKRLLMSPNRKKWTFLS